MTARTSEHGGDPRLETMAAALDAAAEYEAGWTEEAARMLAFLDASDLIVATVPQLRSAVEAHHEWVGAGRVGIDIPDCGTDVAARLRARRR